MTENDKEAKAIKTDFTLFYELYLHYNRIWYM